MGVILKMSQGQSKPGPLTPGKNLRLEALTHKAWIGRTFKAFQVAPPFRLRFLAVCQDKYAFAHLTVHHPPGFQALSRGRLQQAAGAGGG